MKTPAKFGHIARSSSYFATAAVLAPVAKALPKESSLRVSLGIGACLFLVAGLVEMGLYSKPLLLETIGFFFTLLLVMLIAGGAALGLSFIVYLLAGPWLEQHETISALVIVFICLSCILGGLLVIAATEPEIDDSPDESA